MPAILISTHAEEDFAELVAASSALAFIPKAALSGAAIRDASDVPNSAISSAGPTRCPLDGDRKTDHVRNTVLSGAETEAQC